MPMYSDRFRIDVYLLPEQKKILDKTCKQMRVSRSELLWTAFDTYQRRNLKHIKGGK